MANPLRRATRRLKSPEKRSTNISSGPLTSSKKVETKKATRRDATRWSNAIRAVLKQEEDEIHQQKQQKKPKHEEEVKDPLGDQITLLLNSHPAFRFQPTESLPGDPDPDSSFHPLLSSHNLNRLKYQMVGFLKKSSWIGIPKSIVGLIGKALSFIFKHACSFRQAMIAFVGLTFTAVGIMCAGFFIGFEWTFQGLVLVASIVMPLLVDWKELQANCPPSIRNVLSHCMAFAQWVDTWILQGRRFAGREWDRFDFVWTKGILAESRLMSLWNLPPPSVKEGRRLCLDEAYMTRDEWSPATTKHIVAINFCYVVLREDFVRQQASCKTEHGIVSSSQFSNNKKRDKSKIQKHGGKEVTLPVDRYQKFNIKSYSLDEFDVEGIEAGETFRMNRSMEEPMSPPAPNLDRVLRYMRTESHEPSSASTSVFAASSDGSAAIEHRSGRKDGSDQSWATTTDLVTDLAWIDVGAKIGIRLLNSANVQRAMASQDTAERIKAISQTVESNFRLNRRTSYLDTNAGNNVTTENQGVAANAGGIDKETDAVSLPLSRPVHSMWTSASAVAATPGNFSVSSLSDVDDESSVDSISKTSTSRLNDARQPLLRPRWSTLGGEQRLKSETSQPGAVSSEGRVLQERSVANCGGGVLRSSHPNKSTVVKPRGEALADSKRSNSVIEKTSTLVESSVVSATRRVVGTTLTSQGIYRRPALEPGVKVVVPLLPRQPGLRIAARKGTQYQMATVVSSKRINIPCKSPRLPTGGGKCVEPNCLSVTAKLDKSFLRDGEFAEITFRILDEWSPRYMPRHSKFPIGACVATTYGVGVLVGWRVEDDCHVVRSLWQRRGHGAANAYLNRNAIHATVAAAIGFNVQTNLGEGKVIAYVHAGRDFRSGRYYVTIQDEGRYKNQALDFSPKHINTCPGPRFLPIIEHIREAAQYQIQIDNYNAALRQSQIKDVQSSHDRQIWDNVSKCMEIFWTSFLKAIDEDKEFDEGLKQFMNSIVEFLERLDRSPNDADKTKEKEEQVLASTSTEDSNPKIAAVNATGEEEKDNHGFWIMNDLFGGVFQSGRKRSNAPLQKKKSQEILPSHANKEPVNSSSYKRAFAVIRALMKTVSIARAASVDQPNFKLALSVCYDFLLFVRTVIKVQQKNVSPQSLAVWRRALEEILSVFGPLKERMEKIGRGIAERMERQGNRAKIKVLRFVDIVLADELLLLTVEQGEWDQCAARLEQALVSARIIAEENREHYRKTAKFVYDQIVNSSAVNGNAAARNSAKLANLATVIQLLASPRRSFLKLFQRNEFLEMLERILVRVFQRDEQASRMLTIHAAHFQTIHHLRMLKDFTFAGKIWIPLLDAAEQEFSWVASRMPDSTKEFLLPLSNLFSLGVAQFHKINGGDLTKDWLDFLMEDEAVRLIHDIDMKLILALESFCRDVKEVMVVLPYYPSIDEDLLNLVDELDIDSFLKEASEAIDDPDRLAEFIQDKAAVAVERFLDYLPRMSIPMQRRDLANGLVLTCRNEDGGDLTLSDVQIKRENLSCRVMGNEVLSFPMLGDHEVEAGSVISSMVSMDTQNADHILVEESILDQIREMLERAQQIGCWRVGVGGVGQPPTDPYVCSALNNLPVSAVLNCAIELWRNLEIDDDELLEIAIRDVSFQIQLNNKSPSPSTEIEVQPEVAVNDAKPFQSPPGHFESKLFGSQRRRFNPRLDPTVLFFELKKLTINLDKFRFRIEKGERKTIFDPVFEGRGTLAVQNISIKLEVECRKERLKTSGGILSVPALQLRELEVSLEKVKLKVKSTGADWLLNKVVRHFSHNITHVVQTNLREQIELQIKGALENLNSYFAVNPELLLGLLGIAMDDLDEAVE